MEGLEEVLVVSAESPANYSTRVVVPSTATHAWAYHGVDFQVLPLVFSG